MGNQDFIKNININDSNSLVELLHTMDPEFHNEANVIEHSLYYDNDKFKNLIAETECTLRILNLNCADLRSKYENIKLFLANCNNSENPISVITLQETHFNINTDENYYELQDYTLISEPARINRSGGLAMYIHNDFLYHRITSDVVEQNSPVYESMYVEIFAKNRKHKKYIIANVYRRPHDKIEDLSEFITDFPRKLNMLNEKSKHVYVAGDFNIDLLLLKENQYFNTFYEHTTAHGFFPKITRPTRITQNSHTLIDNLYTNNLTEPHVSGIITIPISDHLVNFTVIKDITKSKRNMNPKYFDCEVINRHSVTNFRNSIKKADIMAQLDKQPNGNPNINYNILDTIISTSKAKHIPKKKKKFNKRIHKKEKWMTDDLLNLVNTKNDKYVEWKSTSNPELYHERGLNFKTFDNIVKQDIENARQKFYYDTFLAQKNDMKKTWATINETLNRNKKTAEYPSEFLIDGKNISDPTIIANSFNDFFSNIGTKFSSDIIINNKTLAYTDYLSNPVPTTFKLDSVTSDDVLDIISKLKNKKSSGKDGISNKLLKEIKFEIIHPLTLIINQSIQTGIFPDALKIAKVKPLYKKGDSSLLNNYRPISLLPTISKVFERVIYIQLYDYFNSNNLLVDQQYGFRSLHSTELASVKLIDSLLSDMDNLKSNKTPITIFLDLSKAFDTLNFDIMINKLKYYGIKGTELILMENYLINRYQYVEYDSQNSDLLKLKTGIPQGSLLGPLFFSIYINDLVKCSDKFSFLMYADDTTIFFNLEDFASEMAINNELEKINNWLKLNKLTLNVEKTKYMMFHKRRKITPINISLNNSKIEFVHQFKFLGLLIDENLSWNNHINMITNKLSKINGILHKLKCIYPLEALLTIYNALCVSHINYGSLVWGTHVDQLAVLQKKLIRNITRSNYIAHSEPILKRLNLLSVTDMFSLKVLKFLHKLSHNKLPTYFNTYRPYLEKIITPYSLRPHPLPLPPTNHVYAESRLIVQLVKIKNEYSKNEPLIIKKICDRSHSLYGFSNYVTNIMLNKYSYQCHKLICRTCNRI